MASYFVHNFETHPVISGRVIRELVVVNVNTLMLKQIFVRHVSHEIRCAILLVEVLLCFTSLCVRFQVPAECGPCGSGSAHV